MFYHLKKIFSHPQLTDLPEPVFTNQQNLPSWFETSTLASHTFALAMCCLARYQNSNATVTVDQHLVNLWYGFSIQPIGWKLPEAWDEIAGVYQTKDGWIRLHTNAPHHKRVALQVLNCQANKASVQKAVKNWHSAKLEQAIVNLHGCAAVQYSIEKWREHPQGKYSIKEPAMTFQNVGEISLESLQEKNKNKPLKNIRILDLTRVLAGPVATRFLAGFGAQVLRIDPEDWNEDSLIPEVTLGKRCAQLNLKNSMDKQIFLELIKVADVLVHGYRADALENLGLSADELQQHNPKLINVALNAYGWNGPWRNRRGFDSLVQMSCGITEYAQAKNSTNQPEPLPVQALDHATGYLMASAVIQCLEIREKTGQVQHARASLAATANLLLNTSLDKKSTGKVEVLPSNINTIVEKTAWGDAKRIKFPGKIGEQTASWELPANSLRSSLPSWES